MDTDKTDFSPSEGTDRQFRVTDDGKLEAVEDDEQNFEEDLTFDD